MHVHPDVQGRVYTPAGDGSGVVLVNGTAAGAWSTRLAGERMQVELDMFARPGARLRRTVEDQFEVAAAFLGARTVSLNLGIRVKLNAV